jgi:hypothetical protein
MLREYLPGLVLHPDGHTAWISLFEVIRRFGKSYAARGPGTPTQALVIRGTPYALDAALDVKHRHDELRQRENRVESFSKTLIRLKASS